MQPNEDALKAIGVRESELMTKLKSESKWHGTVGDLHSAYDWAKLDLDGGHSFKEQDHPGAQPWMIAMKRNFRRYGPLAVPSCGPPSILVTLCGVYIHAFPACELLKEGIPLSNYEHYVGTPDGGKNARARGVTQYLPKGSLFFVPAGWLMMFVYYGPPPNKGKDKVVDAGSLILAPFPLGKALAALDDGTKQAMLTWHNDTCREKTSRLWADRKEFLGKVLSAQAGS